MDHYLVELLPRSVGFGTLASRGVRRRAASSLPSAADNRPRCHSIVEHEGGIALLITLLALLIVSTAGMMIAQVATIEMELAGNYRASNQAFFAADGAAEHGLSELLAIGRARGRFPTAAELSTLGTPALSQVGFPVFQAAAMGPETTAPLTSGFYQGLVAVTQPFMVTATAETTRPPLGRSTVAMTADFDIIPIFQFAIFYEEDLEMLPGPSMTLNGRVHSNSDIYIGSNNTLTVDSVMTAAQDIYNYRKNNGASMSGGVAIRDANGGHPTMSGLDSSSPVWAVDAINRWDGNVRSGDHGVNRLNMTIEDPSNPRIIIEPGYPGDAQGAKDGKIWYDADIRIVNGRGFDGAGNPISLLDPLTNTSAIGESVIFDQREQKYMLVTEVDMEKLGRIPGYPANPDGAIVYVGGFEPGNGMQAWPGGATGVGPDAWKAYDPPWWGTDTTFAVKLTNGDDLPGPLSVVSDNPTYVRGDYNTVNKVGAAVMADAVTILSNRWGDVNGDGDTDDPGDGDLAYSEKNLSDRNAWSTSVNAAMMLGNTDTIPNVKYNGGVENVMRFLERWSGDTYRYRGSIIDLWNSVHATGDWKYGNPVYQAPSRDWAFDTDFLSPANLPPGTPNVYTIRVLGWDRQ